METEKLGHRTTHRVSSQHDRPRGIVFTECISVVREAGKVPHAPTTRGRVQVGTADARTPCGRSDRVGERVRPPLVDVPGFAFLSCPLGNLQCCLEKSSVDTRRR